MHLDNYLKKYSIIYSDVTKTANSLKLARKNNKMFYRGNCCVHGATVLYTKDNTCPICQKINREKRYSNNKSFNRGRFKTGELKKRALRKNVPFNLTTDIVRDLISKTTICPVFNIPIQYSKKQFSNDSPSVDRLIPKLGYVLDNVHIMCNRANRIKSDGTPKEHLQIARWQFLMDKNFEMVENIDKLLGRV